MSGNQLKRLPKSLSRQLTHLNLSFNNFSQLPDDIFKNFSNLIHLDVSGNSLKDIPELLFSSNPNLEKLVWEKDDCHQANLSRNFPKHLFDSNFALQSFSYSTRIRNESSSCRIVTFPNQLFKNQESSFKSLKLTDTLLDWNELGNFYNFL